MIIMGGTFPNLTGECDVPTIYGQHGLDLGKNNAEGAKWAKFNPNLTTYNVPTEIAQVIGGEGTGGATVLAPTSGWAERDLQKEFQLHFTPTTRTPTRYIPTPTAATAPTTPAPEASEKSDKKTVIAGAVGGSVGGLLLIATVVGICLCIRRRRRRPQEVSRTDVSELPPQSTANINDPPKSMQQGSFPSPSVTQYAHSPQGSPPPASDHTWSRYESPTPIHPHSPMQFSKEGTATSHYRVPSDQTYNHPLQSSPASHYDQSPRSTIVAQELPYARSTMVQEMPSVRSPLGFTAGQQPQPSAAGIDPYFAQNPPRGTGI
jgi:hypothetical protein